MKLWFAVVFSVLIFSSGPVTAQEGPVYNIENVTGDLYRFQSGDFYGVFLVTDEGVILADPISTEAATWLKRELWNRFAKEVRVIIYSHSHPEHISGAEVFLDSLQVAISQKMAKPKIIEGGYTVEPSHTFANGTFVELGGNKVFLYHLYPPHSEDLIAIYFEQQKAIFLSDIFYVETIYFPEFMKTNIAGATEFIRKIIENLEVEFAIPSHGPWGTKEDLAAYRDFLIQLNSEVSAKMQANKSLEQIQAEISKEDYNQWPEFLDEIKPAINAVFHRYYSGEYFPLNKVDPRYPRIAREKQKCGMNIVEYDIKNDGTTENVRVVYAEPKKVFERASKKAAEQYEYFTRSPIKGVKTIIYYGLEGVCHWEFK